MKKYMAMFSIIFIILNLTSCKEKENKNDTTTKINVVVTFNPLEEFVSEIGKDKVKVDSILPKGIDAHEFEPKIKDIKKIAQADLFVYNGLGIEPWAKDIIQSANNKNLIVVKSTDDLNLIKIDKYNDPHTWLSLLNAKKECSNIKETLVELDPKNSKYYEDNYDDFCFKLDKLYREYDLKFKSINNKDFITGHAAFGYLCRDFDLNQKSIENVFSQGESSAKKLKALVDYCKNNKIKIVFMEDLASPKISKTLACEVRAKVEKIDTIENDTGKNYLQSMRENLDKIYNSLK